MADEEKKDERKGMTREELLALIREEAGKIHAPLDEEVLKAAVEKAMAPLKQQQTDWFGEMRRGIAEERKDEPPADKSLLVGKMLRALAKARGNVDRAIMVAKEWKDDTLVKAMEAGVPTAGGFLVPEVFSNDVIQHLKARSVVRKLGARTLPMVEQILRIPKITAGASASYTGESTNITSSQLGTGQVTLSAKKLTALVPVSNDLLRSPSAEADRHVRDDMVRSIAAREDQAFIRDDGTSGTPKGLRYWATAANIITANATVSLANRFTDLGKLVVALKAANIPMTNPAWIFAPRTENDLATVLNSNGIPAFRDEILQGKLWSWPIGVTTNVPTNLGSAGTQSEIYLVDMDEVIIGDRMNLVLDVSSEAAYYDGSAVVAAFSRDETVVRVILEHDLVVKHDEAVAVLTAVTWGV